MTIAATGQTICRRGGIIMWTTAPLIHCANCAHPPMTGHKLCEGCHKAQRHEERKAIRQSKKRAEDRARRSRTTCRACGCLILKREDCPGCLAALVARMTGHSAEWARSAA